MADGKYRQWTCGACGVAVSPRSRHCAPCFGRIAGEAKVAAHNRFTCEGCGKESHRRLGGSNKARGGVNRWCSQSCRKAQTSRLHAEVATLRRMQANNKPKQKALGWADYYRAKQGHVWEPRACVVCAASFVKAYGKTGWRSYCSDGCKAAAERKAKRTQKSARRALMRGAQADQIDPLRVFERDGWRCHMCKQSTPQRLRGTYQDRAPELDHVLPLAMGGAHTWGNVACACRACNIAKGARPMGQLGLGIAA